MSNFLGPHLNEPRGRDLFRRVVRCFLVPLRRALDACILPCFARAQRRWIFGGRSKCSQLRSRRWRICTYPRRTSKCKTCQWGILADGICGRESSPLATFSVFGQSMQRKANPAALKKVTGLAFLRHFVRCIPKSEGDLPRGTLQLREEHGFDAPVGDALSRLSGQTVILDQTR